MKATLTRADIRRVVEAAYRGSARWTTIPVLGHCRLVVDEGLTIMTSDRDTFTVARASASDVEPGLVVVEAAGLRKAVKALKGASVTLDGNDEGLTVSDGRVSMRLDVFSDEMPAVPILGDVRLEGIGAAVGRVLHAAAKDDTRPALHGVYIGAGSVVATDSGRMAVQKALCAESLIVPYDVCKRATGDLMLGGRPAFVADDVTIFFNCVEATYPAWETVLPQEPALVGVVDMDALCGAARAISTTDFALTLTVAGGRMTLRGDSGAEATIACLGNARATVNAEYLAKVQINGPAIFSTGIIDGNLLVLLFADAEYTEIVVPMRGPE